MGLAILTAAILVVATVVIHYEGLRALSVALAASAMSNRRKVLVAVLCIVPLHIIEIALYAAGYWAGDTTLALGGFAGSERYGTFDYFFFSAEAFTTLGLGDTHPTGPMRLLAGIEAMNGLLLIGWSVTFTFFEMQRYWTDERANGR